MEHKATMLTLDEAAKVVVGLKKFRIRQMCLDGVLPYIKAGRKILINEKHLLRAIGEDI